MSQFESTFLTKRFSDALAYAVDLHQGQKRKGTDVPYIAHLMAVASLVLEDGGDEDQTIAALLHDAVEDQGGYATLDIIRARFGERVAMIVDGCTDSFITPKPPWRQRKEQYLEHLRNAQDDVRRVSLADKLHNARSVVADLFHQGNSVWERFNGKQLGTVWYYSQLALIFDPKRDGRMADELRWLVKAMQDFPGKDHNA